MNDTKQAQQMINAALSLYDAKIKAGQANPLNEIQPILLDLSIARSRDNAQKISFPFKSLRVSQATDLNTFIYIVPESNNQGRGATRIGLLDSFETEYGFTSCYIYWDAQPNKSVLVDFFTTSNIKNGRLLLDQNSGVGNFTVGLSDAPIDGFSYIYKVDLGIGAGVAVDMALTNVSAWPDNSPMTSFFKVPKGYYAEILGAEASVTVTMSNHTIQVRLMDTTEAFNTASSVSSQSSLVNKFINTTRFGNKPAGTLVKLNLSSNNNIIDEQRLIIPMISQFSDVLTAGYIEMLFLIRLKKKVG